MSDTTVDTDAIAAELVEMHNRWPNIRPEIDMALVGLVRSGWTQVQLAAEFGVLGQEISRRINRCGDCDPGPDDLTDDPARLWSLYTESEELPAKIDAHMAALIDAGWRVHKVGELVGVSKQMVSKRVKRHRARVEADG